MAPNVGNIDRILRAALGIVLLYLALFSGLPIFATAWIKYLAVVVGLVMLIVAVSRFCPIYSIFGFRTCRT